MTQYLLSVYPYGTPLTDEQMQDSYKNVDAFNQELKQAGAWVFAGGLEEASTATVVRAPGGQIVTTDGPFAETKEQIGGYDVIECADLDEAIAVASRHPVARIGTIEVRPLQQRADDL
jgi:hypothetical protein